MSCRELPDDNLWAYIDEELAVAEREEVAAHLVMCAACAARAAGLRLRPLALGGQRLAVPPPDFRQRVMRRVAAAPPPRHPDADPAWVGWLLGARRLAAFSAAALLLALLSAAVVGGVLATPAVEAAPAVGAPLANSMAEAMRRVLGPLRPFFAQWGSLILMIGMLAAVMAPGLRALVGRYQGR